MTSKAYFNKIANKWDELRGAFFSQSLREKVLSSVELIKGKTAADIGAGSGFIAEGLIQRGMKIIAVDQSEAMINIMKKKFSDYLDIEFKICESENLPVETETIDYVFANMYLHHVEHPALAIKEMTRILKKGGKLVISDLDEHTFEFLRTEQFDRWLGFKRDDIKQWYENAGLKNINIACADENCCANSNSKDQSASISIFIATGEK